MKNCIHGARCEQVLPFVKHNSQTRASTTQSIFIGRLSSIARFYRMSILFHRVESALQWHTYSKNAIEIEREIGRSLRD